MAPEAQGTNFFFPCLNQLFLTWGLVQLWSKVVGPRLKYIILLNAYQASIQLAKRAFGQARSPVKLFLKTSNSIILPDRMSQLSRILALRSPLAGQRHSLVLQDLENQPSFPLLSGSMIPFLDPCAWMALTFAL